MEPKREICFRAEATLGKLAKWLRILGFDTVYQRAHPGRPPASGAACERILLTRTKRVCDRRSDDNFIFVVSDDPLKQLREVVQALGIAPEDMRPFSRCIRCNALIRSVDREDVRGRVPDHVWETQRSFRGCPECRRLYWAGSHTRHSREIIDRLFEPRRPTAG